MKRARGAPRRSPGYDFYVQQEMHWRWLATEKPPDLATLAQLHLQLSDLEDQILSYHRQPPLDLGFNCGYRLYRGRAFGLELPLPDYERLPALARELEIPRPAESRTA
jgi:hypothetical protein